MKKELSIILPVFNEKDSLPIMVRILNSSIKFQKEIIIVYDSENDNTINVAKDLVKEFDNVKLVKNNISKGVRFAVETGVQSSKYDIILITAVDEIFPIIAIDQMIAHMIDNNLDFISGTRYSKGGIRLGGSLIGSIFSRIANKFFQLVTNIPLSDCTTGIKMMKKKVWQSIQLESKPIGWAYSFELSIKVYLNKYKIGEYPLKSVDRLFGGSSTFRFGPWLKEYLRWFIWGVKKIKNKNEK
jgi:dolichol-phosphate mannosyltransferase